MKAFLLIILTTFFSFGAFGSVTVSSPAVGSTVSPSIYFVASSNISGTVNMQVWEGSSRYAVHTGTSINQQSSIPLSAGAHTVTIEAVGSGSVTLGKTIVSFTVGSSSGGGGGTGSIPTPPSNAIVINNIDDSLISSWKPCTGPCASCPAPPQVCTSPAPSANYNLAYNTSVTRDGHGLLFQTLNGPAYADVVWGHSLGVYDSAKNFIWDFWVQENSTSQQALEFDFQQVIGGKKFIFGSQCTYRGNNTMWDTWNEIQGKWIPTNVPCVKFSVGVWHHIVWYYQRLSNDTAQYVTLQIDGVNNAVNVNAPHGTVSWGDLVDVQIQLDTNSSGTGFSEYIDQMKATLW